MENTKKLLRFEKASKIRIETLADNALYFSSFSSFNDLFDVVVDSSSIEHQLFDIERIKNALMGLYGSLASFEWPLNSQLVDTVNRWLNNPEEYDELDIGEGGYISIRKQSALEGELRSRISEVFDGAPICCFFESDVSDPLMWAHYSDNHSGICVEYEFWVGIFNLYNVGKNYEVLPMTYATSKAPLDPLKFLLNPYEEAIRSLSTKSVDWAHEKEVRIISKVGQVGRGKLPERMKVSKVYLGLRFMTERRELLDSVLDVVSQCQAELFVMVKNNTAMTLEPMPWTIYEERMKLRKE